jgi:hypothetical protein
MQVKTAKAAIQLAAGGSEGSIDGVTAHEGGEARLAPVDGEKVVADPGGVAVVACVDGHRYAQREERAAPVERVEETGRARKRDELRGEGWGRALDRA